MAEKAKDTQEDSRSSKGDIDGQAFVCSVCYGSTNAQDPCSTGSHTTLMRTQCHHYIGKVVPVSRGWWCFNEDMNKDFQTLFLLSNVHIVFHLGNVNVASYKIDKIMFFYTWNRRHIENRINRVLSNHSVMQSSTRLKLRSSRALNNKARVVCIIGQAFSRHTQLS